MDGYFYTSKVFKDMHIFDNKHQVKTGQSTTGQKTQQIQLQQLQQPGSAAGSIQQQILLRSSPSLSKATGQTHIQGLYYLLRSEDFF